MINRCGDCKHFTALYLKAYCGFIKSDYGYCRILQSTKQKSDCCKIWTERAPEIFDGAKYKKELVGALTRLNGIAIILSELTEKLTDDKE